MRTRLFRMLFSRYSAFIVLALFSQLAHAEIRLSGRVVDENNSAVPGVLVTLRSAGDGAALSSRWTALSDPTGSFYFVLPSPGEYLIGADHEGYFRLRDKTILLDFENEEVTLVLNETRELFESVDVSYAPPAIDFDHTVPQERLSNTELLALPYPSSNNIRSVVKALPGVTMDSAGGIHLNGGGEEQILYTLDGFQINDPLTGRFESRLSVESVRSIEVTGGSIPAEFGKGSSGAMAIKTSTGDDRWRYSGTNFVPGLENRKGLIIGGWTPRFGISGPIREGRAWFSESMDIGYNKTVLDELPEGQDRTVSWRIGNLLRTQVNLTPSHILYAGFLSNIRTAPRSGLGVLSPPETTVDQRSRQWFFNVKDQVYFSRGALVEFGYGANRTFGREVPQGHDPFQFLSEGRRGNYFVDAVRKASRDQLLVNVFLPSFNWGGSHQIKAGIDLDRLDYWQDVRRTTYQNFRVDGSMAREVTFAGNGEFNQSNFEAATYVHDSWRPRPSLLLELGLRQDWDHIVGDANLSPRLGFSWTPPHMERTKISGGFGLVYEMTNLRVFTRPFDQYSIARYYDSAGEMFRGPVISIYQMGPERLRAPRYNIWNLALEQEMGTGLYGRIRYVRKRGREGFTYRMADPEADASSPAISGFTPAEIEAIYHLGNLRRDVFDSVEITMRQVFMHQYEWLASYTRSRSLSNAVHDVSIDDPFVISNNVGRMPWDAPNRFMGWGLLPTWWPNWAVACFLEIRDGLPFSIQEEDGSVIGQVNNHRFPAFFELNVHMERRFIFGGHRWALRGGFNNITNHKNYTVVNNNAASPHFLSFYGSQSRALNFRIRWLGKN